MLLHMPVDGDSLYKPRVVLLYVLGILQGLCGFYIPEDAKLLWWAIGIGSFLLGLVYLQYLYSSHFFVDIPVAACIDRIMALGVPHWCHTVGGGGGFVRCYPLSTQDLSSFFFVLMTHFTTHGTWSYSRMRAVIVITAYVVYSTVALLAGHADPRSVAVALVVGALIGIAKVMLFRTAFEPLCIAIHNRLHRILSYV
jgi:hypothetical protein